MQDDTEELQQGSEYFGHGLRRGVQEDEGSFVKLSRSPLLRLLARLDASKVGVGAVLYQTRKDSARQVTHEGIGFASKKFSNGAMR